MIFILWNQTFDHLACLWVHSFVLCKNIYTNIKHAPARTSLTPAVPVADVRETPDVAQIDGEADDGEEKLDLGVPCLALGVLGLGLLYYVRLFVQHGRGHRPRRHDALCVITNATRATRVLSQKAIPSLVTKKFYFVFECVAFIRKNLTHFSGFTSIIILRLV